MPIITGALIGGGAALIGGALSDRKNQQISNQNIQYQKEFAKNSIQWRTDDAQAAGIHPLYAMGAQTSSFQNQQPTGSAAGDALGMAGRQYSRASNDLTLANVQLTKAKTAQIRANSSQDVVYPGIEPVVKPGINRAVQEIQKGRVDPYVKKNPEQNLNIISPISTARVGTQTLKIPVDNTDQFMEDPAMVAAATYFYHGNKNINWRKMLREYTGTPLGHGLAQRNPKAMAAGYKFAETISKLAFGKPNIQNTFFKRKPRQVRGF